MSIESISTPETDPLKAVADALDKAVKATKEGAEGVASDAIPAANQFLSRLAYHGSYALSYGVVFPTMLILRSIPKENAAVHGFIDGARAAMDTAREMKNKPAPADLAI